MTDQEFRRLSRAELIEIIFEFQRREDAYRKKIEELESQLADKRILIDEAGSIAEAALRLNHIFENAQAAADQYLQELQQRVEEKTQEKASDEFNEEMLNEIEAASEAHTEE